MADEREGQGLHTGNPSQEGKVQTGGRQENAAQPLNAAPDNAGAERYPSVNQDEAAERTGRIAEVTGEGRSFEPKVRNETAPGSSSGNASNTSGSDTEHFPNPRSETDGSPTA